MEKIHHKHCAQTPHLDPFSSIFTMQSIYARRALKSFPTHNSPWARRTLWTLIKTRQDQKCLLESTFTLTVTYVRLEMHPTHWWPFGTRCASSPWFSYLTLEHKDFIIHSSGMVARKKAAQSNNNAWNNWVLLLLFKSLLDHLWILSALVVPLAQDDPEIFITILFELPSKTSHIWNFHCKSFNLDTYRKPLGTSFSSFSIKAHLSLKNNFIEQRITLT